MPIQKVTGPFPEDSHLMATRSNLSMTFRTIAHKLICPFRSIQTEEAYARIKQVYGVGKDEANILALFLARPHWCCPSDDVLKSLSLQEGHLQECLSKLEKRTLIIPALDWEKIQDAHALDRAFILSVQEDLLLPDAQAKLLENLFERAVDNPFGAPKKKAVPRHKLSWPAPEVSDPEDKQEEEKDELQMNSFLEKTVTSLDPTPIKDLDEALARYDGQPFGAKVLSFIESLSLPQKIVLFFMLKRFKYGFIRPVRPAELTDAIANLFPEHIGALMEKGLVCSCYVWDREANSSDTEYYRITPEVATLFKGKESIIDKRVVSSIGAFVPSEAIEEKELFFPAVDRKDMERIRLAAIPAEYDRIISELKAKKLRPCLSVLMYGPPGTGKTEFSLQVARETGRALLKADASKLNGIYIGEGAINYRNLFQTYRYICAVSGLAPILFLDEGDGMMSKRISDVQRAADKDSNSIQNVLLEELNTLPGLVIVTTNLVSNLDEAMFRRFMIKAQFHLPDAEARTAIWLSKLPSLTRDEAATLAREFPISGGLIDNVVSMATMDEILYKRPATLSDLLSYCQSQQMGKELPVARKIGYHYC